MKRSVRILMIEDNFGIRLALKMLLELEGHEVEAVDRGEEGLALLESREIDLILLDLSTNGVSAKEFTHGLQLLCAQKKRWIPFLGIMSGSQNIQRESEDLGADFVVRKPFDHATLLDRLSDFEDRLQLRLSS